MSKRFQVTDPDGNTQVVDEYWVMDNLDTEIVNRTQYMEVHEVLGNDSTRINPMHQVDSIRRIT